MTGLASYAGRALLMLFAAIVWAELPDGTGRPQTEKLCKQCHDVERSVSLRQDRDAWNRTLNKMVAFGMKGTDEELTAVLDYLAKYFPAEEVPRVNVNKASAIELESGLTLRRSQAAAIIAYREKNGDFKTIEDLIKVPALDVAKIEAKKHRITF